MFRACSLGVVGTMGGAFWTGIAAVELRAALALLRVPRDDWPDLAEDVRFMGDAVAEERNRRSEERARHAKRRP